MKFDWSKVGSVISDFGGEEVALRVPKTGLPFFDALQLYGAIDLYIGLRENITVNDAGTVWQVKGRSRGHRIQGRDLAAFARVWDKRKPEPSEYCGQLRAALVNNIPIQDSFFASGRGEWDSSLQDGIRGIAAHEYAGLQSAQTSKSECKSNVPLFQALLAHTGKARTEGIGNILFLPIFEGTVDFAKVVSPLGVRIGVPNVLCAQAAALLALKASLLAEGYEERLSAVVFDTDLGSQRSDNYSGVFSFRSTAVGRIRLQGFVSQLRHSLSMLVQRAWKRQGRDYQATEFVPDALAMARWLVHPVSKNLSGMITSAERLYRLGIATPLHEVEYIQEMFNMAYVTWQGDHEAVRRFAKAVASSIYFARMKRHKEFDAQRKAWYDEVTMLRSAPSAKAFVERALILIEQGHREHSQVGTAHRSEDFDPKSLEVSIGNNRGDFDAFRDLFRMYLIQASTFQQQLRPSESDGAGVPAETTNTLGNEAEATN